MSAVYAADFECTTDESDCRLWAFGIEEIYTREYCTGTSMRGFLNWLEFHSGTMYFHNLAYDGRFIIDALLREGFVWTQERTLDDNTFSTLITDDNKFYSIRVGEIEILDSLKILPMSIAAMAKAFKLPLTKGECDYDLYRAPGCGMTGTEYSYLYRDVHILALSLVQAIAMGATKMTIGASSLDAYKKTLSKKSWRLLFPQLTDGEDEFIRKSYRGGFTYADPRHAGHDLGDLVSVDFNSMYPSAMLMFDYPVGDPIWFDEDFHTKDLFVMKFMCTFSIKPDHVPFIPEKAVGRFQQASYLSESLEPVIMTMTSVDFDLFTSSYDVDILETYGGYEFASAHGLFDQYISHWREVKETSEGGVRTMAKLYLNSLYGKFGTSPESGYRIPTFSHEKDLVRYIKQADERDTVYIPVAAFCTAYARKLLITAINENHDRFVYCDTDSMYLLGHEWPKNIPLSSHKFGHWKVEKTMSRGRFLRSKTYLVTDKDGDHVTCAGMTEAIKKHVTWDNFHVGFSNLNEYGQPIPGWDKLQPKVVPGGVVLTRRKFMIQ